MAHVNKMVSAESRDQSNLASSDSGRTARCGDGSPAGEEAFAAPTLIGGPRREVPAIEDSGEGPEFVESYIIADVVMKSLTSSSTASHVMGATGSSESRRKSRSPPPRGNVQLAERSAPGTPSLRGTRRSRTSPAMTPSRPALELNVPISDDPEILGRLS